jgi:superfamily II DNA/RNA helicase
METNDTNILLLSPTGSGKTLAFLLPIFKMLQVDCKDVQCLILVLQTWESLL